MNGALQWFLNLFGKKQRFCTVKKNPTIQVQISVKVSFDGKLLNEEKSHIECTAENPVAMTNVEISAVKEDDLPVLGDITTNTEDKKCKNKTLDEREQAEILQRYTSIQPDAHLKETDISPGSKEICSSQSQINKSWDNADINHVIDYPFQEKDIMCADNPKDTLVDNYNPSEPPSENSSTASSVEVEEIPPSLLDIVNQNKKAEIEIFNTHLNDIVKRANSLLVELDIAKENLYLLDRIKTVINDASSKIKSRGSEYDRLMLSEFSSENEPLLKFVKEMIEIRKENWAFANLSKDKERERANADLFDKFLEKLFADTPVKEISAEKNFDAARHNEVSSEDVCQGATIIETCQNGFEFDGIILDKAIVKTINTERD